jgi:hypothetical protein
MPLGNNACTITYCFVSFQINTFQLTESNKIGSDQNFEFLSLSFTLFSVTRMALVLQTNPEFVHLGKVGQNKLDGLVEIPFRAGE